MPGFGLGRANGNSATCCPQVPSREPAPGTNPDPVEPATFIAQLVFIGRVEDGEFLVMAEVRQPLSGPGVRPWCLS